MSNPTPGNVLAFVDAMVGTSWAIAVMIQKMDAEFGKMQGAAAFFDEEPKNFKCQWDAEGFGRVTIQFSFKLDLKPFSMGVLVPDMTDAVHVRALPEPLRKASEFIQLINLQMGGSGLPKLKRLDK